MTIKEFVFSQPCMGVNQWIETISQNGLQEHEQTIIKCADHFNRIVVNHSANFVNAISK